MSVTEGKLAELKQLRIHRDNLIHAFREARERYEQEIEAVQLELEKKEQELIQLGVVDLKEPEGPWNVEHEGVVHSDAAAGTHMYEREFVFDQPKD